MPRVSLERLASAQAFVEALRRDVHVLCESFALTWAWLDRHVPSQGAQPHLQLQYGAFTVFEKVWCTNGWSRLGPALGCERSTYRALCEAAVAAFLDKILDADARATDQGAQLHAVAALFGLHLLWRSYGGPERAWAVIAVDVSACRCLMALPERSRRVLDEHVDPRQGLPPPSADVLYVVQALMGQAGAGCTLDVRAPVADGPRLAAQTALMTRRERDAAAGHEPDNGVQAALAALEGDLRKAADKTEAPIPLSIRSAEAMAALEVAGRQYTRMRDEVWSQLGNDAGQRSSSPP